MIQIVDKNDFPGDVLSKIYTNVFGNKHNGFLVEIGVGNCIFPAGSNTACLADMGWKGVYIEPNPDMIDECKRRHNDNDVKVLNYAAGDVEREIELRGDTTVPEALSAYHKLGWYGAGEEKRVHTVKQLPTNDIFEEADVPAKFDLLTVDVEGAEYKVLSGLDFNRYRPTLIFLEVRYNDAHFVGNFPSLVETSKQAAQILLDNGYRVAYEDTQNAAFICDPLGGAVFKV